MPDGRFNLITLGRRRFRILELDRSEPYLVAEIEYIENTGAADEGTVEEAEEVAALFAEQFRLVMAITSQWTRQLNIPGAPAKLADYVASQIEVPEDVKQELLEIASVPERLAREKDLLGDLIRTLTEKWDESREKRFAGSALN